MPYKTLLLCLAALLAVSHARPDDHHGEPADVGGHKPGGNEKEQHEKEVAHALATCNEAIKAPENAVEHLKNMDKLDESKEGKCLSLCLLKAFGMFSEDGHIQKEKFEEFSHKAYKPDHQAKVLEIINSCATKGEKIADSCEHAYNFLECFIEESKKEHIPKPYHDGQ